MFSGWLDHPENGRSASAALNGVYDMTKIAFEPERQLAALDKQPVPGEVHRPHPMFVRQRGLGGEDAE
jgi:hypothetical protein